MLQDGNNNPSGVLGVGPGTRSALRHLQSQLDQTVKVNSELEKNIRFAIGVRDDENASHRDRLRAMELLESIAKRGIDIAMYLEKNERIDSGQATESVVFNIVPLEKKESE